MMIPDASTVFTPSLLVYVTFVLIVSLAILAFGYVRARRWDAEWKQRWEQQHGTSLETLRRRQLEGITALTIVEVVFGVLSIVCFGFAVWVISRAPESDRHPLLVTVAFILPLAPLVALVYFDLMRRLTRYKIRRLDQLLSRVNP